MEREITEHCTSARCAALNLTELVTIGDLIKINTQRYNMATTKWRELYKYAACDVSSGTIPVKTRTECVQLADGLLKLNVPGAGFLANIRTTYLCGCETMLIHDRADASYCKHSKA